MAGRKKTLTKEQAIEALWREGELSWKYSDVQKELDKIIEEDVSPISVIVVARRVGKCLAKGTLVKTLDGIKAIEDITPGDQVYGYNSDGSISPANVLEVHYNGKKEVTDLMHNKEVIASCTKDHKWLVKRRRRNHPGFITEEKPFGKFITGDKIVRVTEPVYFDKGTPFKQAYALGALLGDGCSREKSKRSIYISSSDEGVVAKVASQVGGNYKKNHVSNYTWMIYPEKDGALDLPHYNEWCRGRYAHEKIVDLDVVKAWDKESKLQFIAGYLDTDGSVMVTEDGCLKVDFTSQSMSILNSMSYLFLELFGYHLKIVKDKRTKYVNGPCYTATRKNNLYCRIALKQISPYIVCDRKKYKDHYDDFNSNNTCEYGIGIAPGESRLEHTYDISIDNDTNLYLLANNTVTHNSTLLLMKAVSQCIKHPDSIVKYLMPHAKDAKTVVTPILKDILADCPSDLKPEFNTQDKVYNFPNGSQIQLAGSNGGNVESIRGGKAHLCIVDEAAFVEGLTYAVQSVLLPTLLTTGGRLIMASTPSPSAEHEFHTEYMNPFKATNRLKIFTIYDNPNITQKDIERTISAYPRGVEDPNFRREYLCEILIDEEKTIVPEFSHFKSNIVYTDENAPELPEFCDFYVSADIGHRDLTVALFGFYDYEKATLYIQDEMVMNGPTMTTKDFALTLRAKEKINFYRPDINREEDPYKRVMDINLAMQQDLQILHDITFQLTKKDNREAAINEMRLWAGTGRLKVHEKCKHLIYHMEFGQWNDARSDFKRLPDTPDKEIKGGHVDGIPALYYLIRNVDVHKNPNPMYATPRGHYMMSKSQIKQESPVKDFMNRLIGVKK